MRPTIFILAILAISPVFSAETDGHSENVLRFSEWVAPEYAPPGLLYEVVEEAGRTMIRFNEDAGVLYETKFLSGKVTDDAGNPVVGATGTVGASYPFIVLAMGLKPSPSGDTFRFYDFMLQWGYGKLSHRGAQPI